MWRLLIALMLAGLLQAPAASAQQATAPHKLLIIKGTILQFSALTPLDSMTSRPGDKVRLRLERSLVVDGVTLLEAGAEVKGKVTRVRRSESIYDRKVEWKLDEEIALPGRGHLKCDLYAANAQYVSGIPELSEKTGNRNGSREFFGWLGFYLKSGPAAILLSPIVIPYEIYEVISEAAHHDQVLGDQSSLPQDGLVLFVVPHDKRVKR